jgi:uncharacterized protein YciI
VSIEVTEEHLLFLDRLREKGTTNMFGAGPYVQRRFGVSSDEALHILGRWMDTFSERHKKP